MLSLLSRYSTPADRGQTRVPYTTKDLKPINTFPSIPSAPKATNHDLESAKSASLEECAHAKQEEQLHCSRIPNFWRPWSS